jgi:hypothetical protein
MRKQYVSSSAPDDCKNPKGTLCSRVFDWIFSSSPGSIRLSPSRDGVIREMPSHRDAPLSLLSPFSLLGLVSFHSMCIVSTFQCSNFSARHLGSWNIDLASRSSRLPTDLSSRFCICEYRSSTEILFHMTLSVSYLSLSLSVSARGSNRRHRIGREERKMHVDYAGPRTRAH